MCGTLMRDHNSGRADERPTPTLGGPDVRYDAKPTHNR
jgi:hypothetical protein